MKTTDANTILLGKILAETYRTQKKLGIPTVSDATIYGLNRGVETVLENQLESIGFVSKDQLNLVTDILEDIWSNPTKLSGFKGYYDIEPELERKGIDRSTAIVILRYLNANHQFTDLIEKMDTSQSPSECRTFKLAEWDI